MHNQDNLECAMNAEITLHQYRATTRHHDTTSMEESAVDLITDICHFLYINTCNKNAHDVAFIVNEAVTMFYRENAGGDITRPNLKLVRKEKP